MAMNLKSLLQMKSERVKINGYVMECYSVNTLIIGSGAASLNAAVSLDSMGQKDIIICTDNWGGGTSKNAGSDKQTYYKLSLAGSEPDSPVKMAEDLFSGRCMHGDIALCEAQGSVHSFMNLVRLGVPFPQNSFGAWVGYKTDHDPGARATSAGPYTSKKMFEVLSADIKKRRIKVLNRHKVIALLTDSGRDGKKVTGALAINLKAKQLKEAFVLFNSVNIVLGTGGPAGIYESSVYPLSQSGFTGMAFEAGATGQNLTESQFGIASVKFRWNLSGSYQQVIPKYYSIDKNGKNEREFLNDFFPDIRSLTKAIFLKGYQWPFDPQKIEGHGSSLIDLLVYRELVDLGRRVFIDYRKNPTGPKGEKFSVKDLDPLVYDYLKSSNALSATPVERLESINKPAIDLYLEHKIDLKKEPVEIAVCAQHNNGGLKADKWWESDLKHLFPVGEVNGSHGVYRPGGSALNSGQVGSYRAALFISKEYNQNPGNIDDFIKGSSKQIEIKMKMADLFTSHKGKDQSTLMLKEIRQRMSGSGGILRDKEKINRAVRDADEMRKTIHNNIYVSSVHDLARGFLISDLCLTHYIYLSAIKAYLDSGGRSRGSFLVTDKAGIVPEKNLEPKWKFSMCRFDRDIEKDILEIRFSRNRIEKNLVKVRAIPPQELWFEEVWKKNLEDKLTEC
jgi:succinate dehydrogenase/fumarate reductase flavoprotein subunit